MSDLARRYPRHRLDLDGFADTEGNHNNALPTTQSTVALAELASSATRMIIETRFPSREAMDQMIEMGMEGGPRRRRRPDRRHPRRRLTSRAP